jgi:hypothetical protein
MDVREEIGQLAKRTSQALGRSQAHLQPSTIWKIPLLPGFLLWKDGWSIFHTVDSRGLDLPFQSFNTRLTQTWSVPTFPVLAG